MRGPTRRQPGAIALAALFAVSLAGSATHAQPAKEAAGPSAEDIAKARQHYAAGEKAAVEMRWKDAAREYGVAYELTKDPVMFFKLGNAYDKDGDCTAALAYYKRYLGEGKPSQEFTDITAERITACEEKVAASAGTEGGGEGGSGSESGGGSGGEGGSGSGSEAGSGAGTEDPFDDDPPIPRDPVSPLADTGLRGALELDPTWQRTAAWISVGVGVAFGITGTVLGLASSSREDEIQADINFRDTNDLPARFEGTAAERYDDLVDQGKNLELASFIAFGAAGAAVVAAAIFFVIDPGPDVDSAARAVQIGPSVGPDMVGVSAAWRFE